MVQAAATGMLDFREANVLDPSWWLRLRWVIDYISNMHCIKIHEYRLQQHLATLSTLTDANSINHCRQAIEALRNKIINKMAPWVTTGPAALIDIISKMKAQYVQKWGDPDDPEHAAELERLKAYWRGEGDELHG
jgi:hypothetical protein